MLQVKSQYIIVHNYKNRLDLYTIIVLVYKLVYIDTKQNQQHNN